MRRTWIRKYNNDRCSNPLEKLRTTWIKDVLVMINNDMCSIPLEKHRRKLLTMRHTKFTDRKYQNCGHTHSSAKCWGQNKKYKNCGQPTDSSKKMKSFWTALLDGGQGLLVYGVAMLRVWNQLNQYHINVTNTMYKSVYNKILLGQHKQIPIPILLSQ